MPDRPNVGIEADIERLEAGLRQLKVQYDMFFAGAIPKQPLELRSELERLIKRYTTAPLRKYAHRFHFNSLAARYNSLSELWAKTLKGMEEGDRSAPQLLDRPVAASERLLARCRIHDAIGEQEVLKLLHARYLDARRKAGCNGHDIRFESFLRGVSAQAERLRETSGCGEVELRLVLHEGKVLLKARPGR
ncbi:MAG: hypothetical protein LAO51_13060 [Acidobacteriia bacterium]|nr:hypothetical protein [Terriglobia bacterium]